MVYQPKNPLGYRFLITWKQASEIYHKAKGFARTYLATIDDSRLIAHITDSARSVQRNIEEGYKRSTTAEYVRFLGFSRASLEELKGDFEELKREWKEGIRWEDKGEEIVDKGREIRVGEAGSSEARVGEAKVGESAERRGSKFETVRDKVIKEIEAILDLIYGEDCMMGRQIAGLEKKMVEEKTLPQGEMIRRGWRKSDSADKRFWRLAEEKYGIIRDEKGVCRRVEKGEKEEGKDRGRIGEDKGEDRREKRNKGLEGKNK